MKNILLLSSFTLAAMMTSATAAVVLSTDFQGDDFGQTGVASTVASMTGVAWVENGVTAPTTLTGSSNLWGNPSGTGDAVGGYFNVATNVNGSTEGSPAWNLTFTVTVGGSSINLTDIVLGSAETNNSATLGSGNGTSNINLSIAGTAIDETLIRTDESGTTQDLTYTTPITLIAGNSYDVTFTVWEQSSSGNYEAFDNLTFNGSVVPEPSSTALLGLGGLALMLRRRR